MVVIVGGVIIFLIVLLVVNVGKIRVVIYNLVLSLVIINGRMIEIFLS